MEKTSILFVCLGNICRSPVAEIVFRKKAKDANLLDHLEIDSAGTAGWHEGKAPDARMTAAALERGYVLSGLHARQVTVADFDKFDFIIAMDIENLYNLQDIDPGTGKAHVALFLDYAKHYKLQEVPDPYYGGAQGFDDVIDLVEAGSEGLIKEIQQLHAKVG